MSINRVHDPEAWRDLCHKHGVAITEIEFSLDEGGGDTLDYEYCGPEITQED